MRKYLIALVMAPLAAFAFKSEDWLAKREGLENLSFTHTKIRQLPDDLSAWRSLKSLQLGDLDLNPAELSRIRAALPDVAIVF